LRSAHQENAVDVAGLKSAKQRAAAMNVRKKSGKENRRRARRQWTQLRRPAWESSKVAGSRRKQLAYALELGGCRVTRLGKEQNAGVQKAAGSVTMGSGSGRSVFGADIVLLRADGFARVAHPSRSSACKQSLPHKKARRHDGDDAPLS
jgi:hypothetical protein